MFKIFAELKQNGAVAAYNSFDNDAYTFELYEDDGRIRGTFKAKTDMELSKLLLSTEMGFSEKDLFFANGYQAWTTSREFSRSDSLHGMTKMSKISKLTTDMARASGDYQFAEYGEVGRFHSYTYCYLRKKGSREITLYGSKSERQGFTVFSVDMNEGKFTIGKDVEGLTLTAGQEYEMFDIAVINGEFDCVFDRYFFDFMGVKKPKIRHLAGYTSWYNYFQKIDENIILRDLDGMDRAKEEVSIFQIDDGYESAVGDWLIVDDKKFPHGMKYIADKIHEKGYKAGIWLAPFNAQRSSRMLKKHPDWIICDEKTGKKLLGCAAWGGAYTFDIYNAEFRDYLKKVFDTVFDRWGYDMVKLDFLYSQCIQPRGGKTRGEIMCDAADLLRELCGDKLILGCGVPLGACMGVFDACRIGCDANSVFGDSILDRLKLNNETPSSPNAINNAIFRSHLDGRAFCNDPDVFFLRNTNIKYNHEQKLLLGKINAICGNVLFVSDNAGDYDEDTVKHLVDFFKDKDYRVLSAEYKGRNIIRLDFSENGTEKSLEFNIKTGKSNIADCL